MALLPDRAVAVVIDVRPVGGRHREVPVQLTWHDGDLVAVLDLEADQLRPTGAP